MPNWQMPDVPVSEPPSPMFASWADYIARTTDSERMKRCHAASKRANRVHRCLWSRNFSGRDLISKMMREKIEGPCACCGSLPGNPLTCSGEVRLKGRDIWFLIEQAKGRCTYCGSLAVEERPSHPITGAPLQWAHVGRRIGSLEHVTPYPDGRINELTNLRWACLWCNVHPIERRYRALDHGGFYPNEDFGPYPSSVDATLKRKRTRLSAEDEDDSHFEMFPDHECPWDIGKA
jgi:hypothetical protein